MRAFHLGRAVRVASCWIICTVCFFWFIQVQAADKVPGEIGVSKRQPWIMVGLTPEGCAGGCRRLYSVIKDFSGNPQGLIYHFSEINVDLIAQLHPEFIVLSPQGTPWCRYTGQKAVDLQNFLWTLLVAAEDFHVPVLGVCGGHQALSLAFGGKVGPIRGGEDDCMPYSRDRQSGTVVLSQTTQDPIFEGIDEEFRMVESHYDEVKTLPPDFVLLAWDRMSPHQIIRHRHRPVYGIQGHPESSLGSKSAGARLLRNFLDIAKNYNENVRNVFFDRPRLLTFQKGNSVAP
jgi:GMP synthase (glutamine-hydrolysing)